MLGPSAFVNSIEPVVRLTRHASRGKQYCVKSFDLSFQRATSVVSYCMFLLDKKNTLCLRDTVRQTSFGKSAAGADQAAAVFPRDVCLTVLRNYKVFLLSCNIKPSPKPVCWTMCFLQTTFELVQILNTTCYMSSVFRRWNDGPMLNCRFILECVGPRTSL